MKEHKFVKETQMAGIRYKEQIFSGTATLNKTYNSSHIAYMVIKNVINKMRNKFIN